MVTNLSDIAITRLREGKIKPRDLAQTAVSQALSASGLLRDGSNTAVYTDIGLSLVSLALSSVEMYGLVVTSNTVAAAAAPETLGASLVGDAGVVTVAVLFWNYQVLQTTMRCAEDFKKLEDAVPDRHNIESKRQNFTNVGDVTR